MIVNNIKLPLESNESVEEPLRGMRDQKQKVQQPPPEVGLANSMNRELHQATAPASNKIIVESSALLLFLSLPPPSRSSSTAAFLSLFRGKLYGFFFFAASYLYNTKQLNGRQNDRVSMTLFFAQENKFQQRVWNFVHVERVNLQLLYRCHVNDVGVLLSSP